MGDKAIIRTYNWIDQTGLCTVSILLPLTSHLKKKTINERGLLRHRNSHRKETYVNENNIEFG